MLRKCICMIVTVALVVCVSVASVGAVDVSTDFDSTFSIGGLNSTLSQNFSVPRAGNKTVVGTFRDLRSYTPFNGEIFYTYLYLNSFFPDLSSLASSPSGSIGVYFSFAGASSFPIDVTSLYGGWNYTYSLANTSSFTYEFDSSTFNFSTGVSGLYPTLGVQLSARIDDVDSLTSFSCSQISSSYGRLTILFPSGVEPTHQDYLNIYIPSASLVATESSADLDALESVADQIAEGNEVARAMYGDIMNALNALKDDTALMASYINDCLTYLNSIETATIGTYNLCAAYLHNLADIAQTAEDIEAELDSFHTDFMSKLDLLIGTITSESDDIQATMDRIYEQLIAWLETNFKEAISSEFEGSNSDLSQGIANNDAIEQQWTGSLSDTWSAMHIADFSFDPSFTSGFMWVSGWFSNIYNSLGLYGSIIILPLIIGICKLLLGYFRFSGHGHSRGGDANA